MVNKLYQPIRTQSVISELTELWAPQLLSTVNDNEIKVVRFSGEFVWHAHKASDEAFLVVSGEMIIYFDDGNVTLKSSDLYVVPRGVQHKTYAEHECVALVINKICTDRFGDV